MPSATGESSPFGDLSTSTIADSFSGINHLALALVLLFIGAEDHDARLRRCLARFVASRCFMECRFGALGEHSNDLSNRTLDKCPRRDLLAQRRNGQRSC